MIPIFRVTEPPELAVVRGDRLAAARKAATAGSKILFDDYDIVKKDLALMQHNKCCYCEKREEQPKYRDVEHYRPKSLYWWLAWTWENLLFACIDCNREQKRDQFPLPSSASRLASEQLPPGGEQPLVLDPSNPAVDPLQHIEFKRERVQGKERWVPHGKSIAGAKTIEVCGLARPNLLDLYAQHVVEVVRPKLAPFETAEGGGEPQQAVKAWATVTRGLLGPLRPFRALSFDALNVLVTADRRRPLQLTVSFPPLAGRP